MKEYESCDREATNTANWVWASTAIFLAAWITALGLFAANFQESANFLIFLWITSGLVLSTQLVWLAFLARSFQLRQRLFLRQRQIERHLGMLKSIALNVADNPLKVIEYRDLPAQANDDLEKFLKEVKDEKPYGLPDTIGHQIGCLLECLNLGRPGRSALYLLSFFVALAWIAFAVRGVFIWLKLSD